MLVRGSSKEEHDQNLRKVLERTREVGIKWNAEKCVFEATEVSYFGHVLSDKGVQPDSKEIAAIQDGATKKQTRTRDPTWNGELFG